MENDQPIQGVSSNTPSTGSSPLHPELSKPPAPESIRGSEARVSAKDALLFGSKISTPPVPAPQLPPSINTEKLASTDATTPSSVASVLVPPDMKGMTPDSGIENVSPPLPERPKQQNPEIAAALNALSGKLQSGGGASFTTGGATPVTPSIAKGSTSGSALMEELRKQSAPGGSAVRPLRTFKDDVSTLIAKRKTSYVSVVAAEAERRAKKIEQTTERIPQARTPIRSPIFIGLAILITLMGIGILGYALLTRTNEVGTVTLATIPKLVFSEAQEVFDVTNASRRTMSQRLSALQEEENIRLGSLKQFYPVRRAEVGGKEITTLLSGTEFLNLLEMSVPGTLERALAKDMMLGIHAYNGNQFFLILKTNDYERAFAGMLAWEATMERDFFQPFGISPLRTETPLPEATLPTESASSSTPSIASSTPDATATSTVSTTTPPSAPVPPRITTDDFRTRPFSDLLIRNKEVRVLRRDDGSIALLYSFPDKNTIVIAFTEATFVEIVTRMQSIRI